MAKYVTRPLRRGSVPYLAASSLEIGNHTAPVRRSATPGYSTCRKQHLILSVCGGRPRGPHPCLPGPQGVGLRARPTSTLLLSADVLTRRTQWARALSRGQMTSSRTACTCCRSTARPRLGLGVAQGGSGCLQYLISSFGWLDIHG